MDTLRKREDARVISSLKQAQFSAGIAMTRRSKREAEKEVPVLKAALLSATKHFNIPELPAADEPEITLITGGRLIEKIMPFLEAGHFDEAKVEAQKFIAALST